MKVEIKRKRIKNIYIRVDANGIVRVSAPKNTPVFFIEKLLEEKREKIEKAIERQKKKSIDYLNAETIPFLGKEIKVRRIKGKKSAFSFEKDTLTLFLKTNSPKENETLIKKWQKKEAKKIITFFIEKHLPAVGKRVNRVSFKEMKTRWGSCNSKKGYLNFNIKLITLPPICVEYVVVHELVHLIHPNHGKKFYNRVEKIFPQMKQARKVLKEHT